MNADESKPTACTVRVVNVYATPWRFNGELDDDKGTPTEPRGLEQHYELHKEQLPQLLPDQVLGSHIRSGRVALAHAVKGATIQDAKAELFTLPSRQVVLTVTLYLTDCMPADEWVAEPIVEVLEQCIGGNIRIGERTAAEALRADFDEVSAKVNKPPTNNCFRKDPFGESLLAERHQIVFITRLTGEQSVLNQHVIEKILYRSTPPYQPKSAYPRLPKQLEGRLSSYRAAADQNESVQPQRLGMVTPYVSLLYGHQQDVEESIFLSAVYAIGTVARFHYIWREAHQLLWFRNKQNQMATTGAQARDDLEILAERLGQLHFDLTFSVKFPLLRIDTFQSDLYDILGLDNQAKALGQIFDELGVSLRSEITAIEVRERRRAEDRELWDSVKTGLLILIGAPVGFVIAFFGMNTSEVSGGMVSMWDARYAGVYLIASSLALIQVFLIVFPYLHEFALSRNHRRTLWSGIWAMVFGVTIFILALRPHRLHQNDFNPIVYAIAASMGVFYILVSLTLLASWALLMFRCRVPKVRHMP